jgi:hypothetical protein
MPLPKSKKVLLPLTCLSLVFFLFSIVTLNNGCSKSETRVTPVIRDTVVTPPVIKDTITYVTRIEEDYIQDNPTITRRNRDYTFYYDNLKRVIKVGIKNYGGVLFDTATTLLFYTGNSMRPGIVISPEINNTVNYDTTYFTYDGMGRMIKDSSNEIVYNSTAGVYVRRPKYRTYSYPTATQSLTRWFGHREASRPLELVREDTLNHTGDTQIVKLKAQWYYGQQLKQNYALAEAFSYTGFINPLSKLNISGTVFSPVYATVYNEVLGNRNHKAADLSNILPYYLDFYSGKLPSQFIIGGFTANDWLLGAQYDRFFIEVTPWTQRPTYPSKITVSASTGLGSKFVYRYYY